MAYDYLTRTDHDVIGGMLGLATYGGRINTVPPEATASAQRASILDTACTTGLAGSAGRGEESGLGASVLSGSVCGERGRAGPERGVRWGIDHPDTDLADPALNTSGGPWPTLYYQANYPRLQRIKARSDPRNVFRHVLSIRVG